MESPRTQTRIGSALSKHRGTSTSPGTSCSRFTANAIFVFVFAVFSVWVFQVSFLDLVAQIFVGLVAQRFKRRDNNLVLTGAFRR